MTDKTFLGSEQYIWHWFQLPAQNDNVTINKPIMLDTSPHELFSITVESGGRLVWSEEGDYSVRLHYILIKDGGEMHIGAEDCKFEAKASITLLGKSE